MDISDNVAWRDTEEARETVEKLAASPFEAEGLRKRTDPRHGAG